MKYRTIFSIFAQNIFSLTDMNRYFPLSLAVLTLFGYSFTVSALDSRCFTEYAEIPSDSISTVFSA